MKYKLWKLKRLFTEYSTRHSNKMMSVTALLYIGLTVVGIENGIFLQQDFPLCSTSLQPLTKDILFAVMYIVGSLNLVFLVMSEYFDVAGMIGGDNSDNLKEFARKYVTGVFFLVAIEAFLVFFIGYDISCMTPGFPPSPSSGGFI